jgi:hypothetical protein
MQYVKRQDFFELLGLEEGVFDALQFKGHVSLAFGATLPGTPGNYLDLDLVAMAINLALSPTFGRDTATTIVLRFFNNWAYTVARAESDRSQDFFLGIGALGVRDSVKKIPKLYGISQGTLDGINEDFREQDESLVSACLLNISDIIRRLRSLSREAGINLESEFFFLPGDPRFAGIQRSVEREIEARVGRLKKDKKKLATAAARRRRQDIRDVGRADVGYPIEISA